MSMWYPSKIKLSKRLEAKMQDAVGLASTLCSDEDTECFGVFTDLSKKLLGSEGYRFIGISSGGGAYLKRGVVIKYMFVVDDCPADIAIPTLMVKYVVNGMICIQPFCSRVNKRLAYLRLRRRFGLYDVPNELNERNVGWFNCKPVMFDW